MEMKTTAAAIANRLGLIDSYAFFRRKLTKSQVAILMYHRISSSKDNWSLKPLSPQIFEQQIGYFCRRYKILSLDELAQYIHQGESLPEKAVVITFDDGYKDNYLHAFPVLEKYKVPATIFLTTGHIGSGNLFWLDKVRYIIQHTTINRINLNELVNYSLESEADKHRSSFAIANSLNKLPENNKNLLIEKLLSVSNVDIPADLGRELVLSWDEVREMSNNGIIFGAHTVNHPVLTNMPLEQAKWEISQSKKDIEENLGKRVTAFAYPNGDFNPEIVKFIKESGFTCAVSVLPGKLLSAKDSPYELGRIQAFEDFNKFKVALCGLLGDL